MSYKYLSVKRKSENEKRDEREISWEDWATKAVRVGKGTLSPGSEQSIGDGVWPLVDNGDHLLLLLLVSAFLPHYLLTPHLDTQAAPSIWATSSGETGCLPQAWARSLEAGVGRGCLIG